MDNNRTADAANPISLYHAGALTKKQSDAYNALLTQLAKVITNLQNRVSANTRLDKNSNAVACWQYLLNDVLTVVLPEFYVVFHDKTTLAMQRRRLYDMTQAIYFAIANYDTATFVQKIALCDSNYQLQADNDISAAKRPTELQIDSYMTGVGSNASVAYQLRAMADFVTVDGIYYLDAFAPYYNLLIDETVLLRYLTVHSLPDIQARFDSLQAKRYLAFSVPTIDIVLSEPILRQAKVSHLLATWILQEYLHESIGNIAKAKHNNTPQNNDTLQSNTSTNVAEPRENKALAALLNQVPRPLVKDAEQIRGGAKLGGVAVVGLGVAALMHPVIAVVLSIVFIPMMLGARSQITAGLNIEQHSSFLWLMSIVAVVLAVPALFAGGLITATAIQTILLSQALITQSSTNNANKVNRKTLPTPDPNDLVVNQHGSGSYQDMTQKFDTIKKTAVDVEAETIAPIKNYDLPLTLERHGYHLAILLSDTPTEHLKQLITATNTLYAHLDYLQQAHPYLASRVDELVKDLTHNTLVRLDEMASQFVKEGQVNEQAQALFAQQHETRIDTLIVLNLNQVNDLNQTILEKQMSGFADIGSSDERKFRNSVMELKILLRWLIAQQPDEVQATSHQVILDNLERTTLADMQATFFDSQTTGEQRAELQHQLEQLLTHFKQQTTQDIQHHSTDDNDSEIQKLLQLSKSNVSDNANMDRDVVNSQTKTQQFIDFNKQYIKQLLTHWH